MTDTEYDKLKQQLNDLYAYWKVIGIGWWNVRLVFEREGIRQTDDQAKYNEQTYFRVHADWRYLEATIYCSMPQLLELTEEGLEESFVHELMHIMVNEMRADAGTGRIDHEERVCQTLALGFTWLKRRLSENSRITEEVQQR